MIQGKTGVPYCMQMAYFDCHFYNFFYGPPDVRLLGVIAELFIPHENNYGRENLTTTTRPPTKINYLGMRFETMR